MKPPRTLKQACQLTPEQRSFVGNGQMVQKAPAASKATAPQAPMHEGSQDNQRPTPMNHAALPHSPPNPMSSQTVLVPLTTRLQPDTAEALRRAHLQQKLHRASPSTQQQIVETAIRQWLSAHGFAVS